MYYDIPDVTSSSPLHCTGFNIAPLCLLHADRCVDNILTRCVYYILARCVYYILTRCVYYILTRCVYYILTRCVYYILARCVYYILARCVYYILTRCVYYILARFCIKSFSTFPGMGRLAGKFMKGFSLFNLIQKFAKIF